MEALSILENDVEKQVEVFETIHPAGVATQARSAAYDLLRVNSNKRGGGGAALYRARCDDLSNQLHALPEQPARARALELLAEMNQSFFAKTPASWKPFVRRILGCLGDDTPGQDEGRSKEEEQRRQRKSKSKEDEDKGGRTKRKEKKEEKGKKRAEKATSVEKTG